MTAAPGAPAIRNTLLVFVAVAAPAAPARAQIESNETAFSVERYAPPPGPGVFFAAQQARVLEHLAWSVGLSGSLSSRPLVLHDIFTGEEVSEPVRTRLGTDLLAALGLGDHYQVGVALPIVAAQTGDRLRGIGLSEEKLQTTALGDLRLYGKARVVGEAAATGLGVGMAATLTLPSGDEDQFAGEKGAVVGLRLIGSYRRRWYSAAVNLGTRIRTEEVVLLEPARPHGDELVGALAGEALVPWTDGRLSALGEWDFVDGDGGGPSPGELRAGARLRLASGWSFLAGGGFGVTPNEVGSPAWRAVAGVRFEPEPTSDLDGDRVRDADDLCPHRAEDRDGFADRDGCPDPDNDGDRIPDADDQCPQRSEDRDGFSDLDGCPDPDNDGDRVPDRRDRCPDEIGDPSWRGCPAPR